MRKEITKSQQLKKERVEKIRRDTKIYVQGMRTETLELENRVRDEKKVTRGTKIN